jgi:glyoxylase I family protein
VLGFEYLYENVATHHDDDWMVTHLAVHPEAKMRNRFFRCNGDTLLEVFEYSSPDQRTEQPRNSDVGGHHVAFYVDDLDAAVDYLRAADIEVFAGPTASVGPGEGNRWIYFRSPWGMQFELVSYPGGKAFDRENPRP